MSVCISKKTRHAAALALAAALAAGCTSADRASQAAETSADAAPFKPGATVADTLRWHRDLPTDRTAWWDVVGEQQAWAFKNVHQIAPTVNVYRDGPVSELRYRPMDEIAEHPVDTPDGEMGLLDFLHSEHSTTMGLVIVHRGEIVFEAYPRMQRYQKPIFWSVTKAFVSTVLAILEDRGEVDVSKPIEFYIPELENSQLAGITVRNALDMASGIDCPDDYADSSACYNHYESTMGDGLPMENPEDNPYDMLINYDYGYWADQGVGFDYSGANTFLVGWVVEKITGMPFQDVLTREVWRHMGAEADASIFAGRNGIPLTSGGLLANVRDVARFGVLFTPSYQAVSEQKIISDRYVDLILHGSRPELFENARQRRRMPDARHNVYQWDVVFDNDDVYKGGWGGQGLLINPERDYVAAYAGYFKDREHSEISALPVLRQVLDSVFGEGATP